MDIYIDGWMILVPYKLLHPPCKLELRQPEKYIYPYQFPPTAKS